MVRAGCTRRTVEQCRQRVDLAGDTFAPYLIDGVVGPAGKHTHTVARSHDFGEMLHGSVERHVHIHVLPDFKGRYERQGEVRDDCKPAQVNDHAGKRVAMTVC